MQIISCGTSADAAARAFKEPNVGRELRAAYQQAGVVDIDVAVTAAVDTAGRMRGAIENMPGYGLNLGRITERQANEIRARIEQAINNDTYLAPPHEVKQDARLIRLIGLCQAAG